MGTLTINNIGNNICACEALGLSKILKAYSEYAIGETIFEIGFNANSGYTYINLDNGITICSMLGRDVEYIVTDFEDGEETFFQKYQDAINSMLVNYSENLN